jgi:DNA-binding transcriptional ArsR family regulator
MTVEAVLTALADPTRLQVLQTLAGHRGASASTLARELPVTRQMVIKHLTVLSNSGLVNSDRVGREVLFQVRTAPLAETAAWLSSLAEQWDLRLADLKARAEQPGSLEQPDPLENVDDHD